MKRNLAVAIVALALMVGAVSPAYADTYKTRYLWDTRGTDRLSTTTYFHSNGGPWIADELIAVQTGSDSVYRQISVTYGSSIYLIGALDLKFWNSSVVKCSGQSFHIYPNVADRDLNAYLLTVSRRGTATSKPSVGTSYMRLTQWFH